MSLDKNELPFSDLFDATSSAFLEEFVSLNQIAESSFYLKYFQIYYNHFIFLIMQINL